LIERSFQGLSVAVETMRIIEELVEIWPNEVCDIDTVRKMRSLPPQGCYWCGEANHLVKNYPYHLDVRRLTAEQREELIEDLMALKNAVEEEEVCSAPEEGFV